jgi:hypothetical protein
VIVVSAADLPSSKFMRKTLAAFSAAFFVRYRSNVPITRFRITRRPSGSVTRHLKTQILLPLEEMSKLTPPR